MRRRPPERRGVVHQHTVVKHGHDGWLDQRCALEARRRERDVIGLPFAGQS